MSAEFITLIKLLSYNVICKDLHAILANQFGVIKSRSVCYCEMPPNIAFLKVNYTIDTEKMF